MTTIAPAITNLVPGIPPWRPGLDVPAPLRLYGVEVPASWIDFHGHMSEAYYLLTMSEASEPFFDYIGCDPAYRSAGSSLYSVSWRLDFHSEVHKGDRLDVDTILLERDSKRMHVLNQVWRPDCAEAVATGEQIFLHVDTTAGRATDMPDKLAAAASAIEAAHSMLSRPTTVGRGLALKRQ